MPTRIAPARCGAEPTVVSSCGSRTAAAANIMSHVTPLTTNPDLRPRVAVSRSDGWGGAGIVDDADGGISGETSRPNIMALLIHAFLRVTFDTA